MNSNSMRVISPYKSEQGLWVFDDEAFNIKKEPFVSGADDMMEMLASEIPGSDKGFTLFFSDAAFPGYQVELRWEREEHGGNWYYSERFKMEGWLCPTLFHYFDKAPRLIYVKAVPRNKK